MIMRAQLGFNPRPAPRGQATSFASCGWRGGSVSIHARPRGARRLRARRAAAGRAGFNPRPAPRGQATCASRHVAGGHGFNPRPAPRGQATQLRGASHAHGGVSIHARPRGARRRSRKVRCSVLSCFNPRPAPRGQATLGLILATGFHVVSIHARPRGARRREAARHLLRACGVSIHARPRGARRHCIALCYPPAILFQSTPGPEGPGDSRRMPSRSKPRSFNPRPAPRGQAT